ncbi:hypothetical protein FisN_1Hh291 [Fistulifera solaris]|uniref:Exocyst complex component Sec10-like alpha-helical bundle domain-containing protein n=1 Tax=Fistulifera solaris TaxID=1519565 RepID=A0A1Z5JF25_FISSO|nr:hypothetical protein FisN_1Hh291 [Fistulifera solaris]|eukprot:GAX12358.1 hypothetical protein FisN_1Hh291 [Fistulifera solaris]
MSRDGYPMGGPNRRRQTMKSGGLGTFMDDPRSRSRGRSKSKDADLSIMSGVSGVDRIYDTIPDKYLYNSKNIEPTLYFLPRLLENNAEARRDPTAVAGKKKAYHLTLRNLIKAAEEDVRLHRARVQAAQVKDVRLLRNYQLETDPEYKERTDRLKERQALIDELNDQAHAILEGLHDNQDGQGLTQAERAQVHLARWQRALELYVHTQHEGMDWQSIFEYLLGGISEDQDISQVLQEASQLCSAVVDSTTQALKDAEAYVADLESPYLIRLEAHSLYANECMRQVGEIEDQFKTSGRTALQIGHQLEHAELKRNQCEAASMLIRRWWMMESLAETEKNSGKPIDVEAEIRGIISPGACKMDPLFTRSENSLDAAKALKQLRAVVRSRGNAAATGSATTAMTADKSSSRRFAITANLITRTSDAVEGRLLNAFSEVYGAGGIYDFSSKPRPGAIDWRELRALAQALLLFDSGRNLHKRYVDMVVGSRFPELFSPQMDDGDEDAMYFREASDADATRSKLTNLFQRVGEVCTAEFELIAHVFGADENRTDLLDGNEEMPLVVARALLQRVVSDPSHGLQARINALLASIDRQGDLEAAAKKLDTFVVVHEKAAGLFSLLIGAAEAMAFREETSGTSKSSSKANQGNAVESLKGFLRSQELAITNAHRQAYVNLELRLMHHDCCNILDHAGCAMVKNAPLRPDPALAEKGILEEFRAPVLPLHKESLKRIGFTGILAGPLKQSLMIQTLVRGTDSLVRARLMFGANKRSGEATSRVILRIYSQMCSFFGEAFLFPIVETLGDILPVSAPSQPPQLPFDEEQEPPDLGVPAAFWVCLEHVSSVAKAFDRELWAEGREDSQRVWETLEECGDSNSMAIAREERVLFYTKLEKRGEAAILKALNTLSAHMQWILVTGGESMLATGGTRILSSLTGQSGGPYAIPANTIAENSNSPAVKSLLYCLRRQLPSIQAALTQESLTRFWTALSMRMYDIFVSRLLQYYYITTAGAVILLEDIKSMTNVAQLVGTKHDHWFKLIELVALYLPSPGGITSMLTGPEGDPGKGLFAKVGRDQALVFLSRRQDYRYKAAAGMKKSSWVTDMLTSLNVTDPTDGVVNMSLFAASRMG